MNETKKSTLRPYTVNLDALAEGFRDNKKITVIEGTIQKQSKKVNYLRIVIGLSVFRAVVQVVRDKIQWLRRQ